MCGSFFIADLSEVRRKFFIYFTVFRWVAIKYQSEVKYFHNKCYNKGILIEKTLKSKKKNRTNNVTKARKC